MIASICSDPKVLEVMKLIDLFISIIKIVVPIILIFILMFKFTGAIMSGNDDGLKKVQKTAPYNIIAAVLIFLIPNFIGLIVNITFPKNDFNNCIEVSDEAITKLYNDKIEKLVLKVEKTLNIYDYTSAVNYLDSVSNKYLNESKKTEYRKRLDEIKKIIDEKAAVQNPPEIDRSDIVNEARKYIGQTIGLDCSGFVKHKVLKPLNYLQPEIANTSAPCQGRSRGSYGMYLKYREKGQEVWHRSNDAKTPSDALKTFPGECVPGDLLFYTYGDNDCVKHIVVYAGFDGGRHMIIDSNMNDETVRYRAIDAISSHYILLSCARPNKNEG
jgi:hypothetical protein